MHQQQSKSYEGEKVMTSIILFIILGMIIEVPMYYWIFVGIGATFNIIIVIAKLILKAIE